MHIGRPAGIVLTVTLAAMLAAWLFARSMIEQSHGLVIVKTQPEASEARLSHAPASSDLVPPPEMLRALQLSTRARLKQPLLDDGTPSILCGEISPDGGTAAFRRFVFNRAGATGAMDDGTEIYRRFADKICRQQR